MPPARSCRQRDRRQPELPLARAGALAHRRVCGRSVAGFAIQCISQPHFSISFSTRGWQVYAATAAARADRPNRTSRLPAAAPPRPERTSSAPLFNEPSEVAAQSTNKYSLKRYGSLSVDGSRPRRPRPGHALLCMIEQRRVQRRLSPRLLPPFRGAGEDRPGHDQASACDC